MRTFVISDIHGEYEKLVEVFDKSLFNMDKDRLFSLGDLCDRGPRTKEVLDLLMQVKGLKLCLGNHDAWFVEWLMYKYAPAQWLEQGGQQTLASFKGVVSFNKYIEFYMQARAYHIDKNRFFAHAGYPPDFQDGLYEFIWDRSIVDKLIHGSKLKSFYSEIYLGHTPVGNNPFVKHNHWLIDTGCGKGGRLTMIDVDNKEVFQSSGLLHD
jgi:serine/threonine protein phosphatase 1